MFGNQQHQIVVLGKLVQNVVNDKQDLFFKIFNFLMFSKFCIGCLKN